MLVTSHTSGMFSPNDSVRQMLISIILIHFYRCLLKPGLTIIALAGYMVTIVTQAGIKLTNPWPPLCQC